MIRVLLVDDHQILREGLRSLIDNQTGMEVVGEAADGRSALALAQELSPDVVVMDIGLPDLNGIEATRRILAGPDAVKVIALSMHSDRQFVVDMFAAGASGYLLKEGAFGELVDAVRAVYAGRRFLDSRIAGTVVDEFVRHALETDDRGISVLTAREREVLHLLAEGKSLKETASLLDINEKTVEAHRQRIRSKLGLHTVAELTRYAIRAGLITLDD